MLEKLENFWVIIEFYGYILMIWIFFNLEIKNLYVVFFLFRIVLVVFLVNIIFDMVGSFLIVLDFIRVGIFFCEFLREDDVVVLLSVCWLVFDVEFM